MIDLDGLKQINDTHGHAAGDSTLQDLSRALRGAVRDTDAVYRVGGDEFVVLIPFSGTGGAAAAMQRAKAEGAPTFSWGAASLSMLPAGSEVGLLIEMADASLYATRRNVRPISTARPRRHRTALAGAAAAAVVGLGVSSAFMLPSALQQAAIGVPVGVNASGSTGGHSSRTYPRTPVPSSSKNKPPAPVRTTKTETPPSGPEASQVSETEPAVLTVAVSPSPPKTTKSTPKPKPTPSTPPESTTPGGPGSGQSAGTPPLRGRAPHPPGVGKPAPGPLPWTVHPRHPGCPQGKSGDHGEGTVQGHSQEGPCQPGQGGQGAQGHSQQGHSQQDHSQQDQGGHASENQAVSHGVRLSGLRRLVPRLGPSV